MQKIRVLIAKPGLDGHDRGAKVIARALGDAGMDVIYSGLHQTSEMIINAVVEQAVDVVGLSLLSGVRSAAIGEIVEGIRKVNSKHVLVLVGGIIPDAEIPALSALGVDRVFTPGTSLQEVTNYIQEYFENRPVAQSTQ